MSKAEYGQSPQETPPPGERLLSKERLLLRKAGIIFAGASGTGKSASCEELALPLGITQFIKGGGILREHIFRTTGQEVIGYAERPLDVDRWLDGLIAACINTASETNQMIIETRLGGIILNEEIQKALDEGRTPPDFISFLLIADAKTRAMRVQKRHPHLTLEEVIQFNRSREQGDFAQWSKLHPQLVDINPFNPANKDRFGNRIYHYIVNTTNRTVSGGVEHMLQTLVRNGHAIILPPAQQHRDTSNPSDTSSLPSLVSYNP